MLKLALSVAFGLLPIVLLAQPIPRSGRFSSPALGLAPVPGSVPLAPSITTCELILNRVVLSPSPLFSSTQPVRLEIVANFNEINANRTTNAEENTGRGKVFTAASIRDLANPARILHANVRSRGNSSADPTEVEFPKLRVEINDEEKLGGTLFKEARNFRINTHVSTHPTTTHVGALGRLNSEEAPVLEGLGLLWAQTLELATPAYQVVDITYVDTYSRETFKRHALLVETEKKAAERMQASVVHPADFTNAEESGIHPVEGAVFHLFHKLIDNPDVDLRVNQKKTPTTDGYYTSYNVTILQRGSERFPLLYDLDASRLVGARVRPQQELHAAFGITGEFNSDFARRTSALREHFSKAQLLSGAQRFIKHKDRLYQLTRNAVIGEAHRAVAIQLLDSFFATIERVLNYKVVAHTNVRFYKDPGKTIDKLREAYGEPATLRVGTPVVVLGKENGMIKVAIINIVKKDLIEGEDEVGYIEESVEIADDAPFRLLRQVDPRDMTI